MDTTIKNLGIYKGHGELSPLEQLREFAIRAFPDNKEIALVNVNGGRFEAWELLANAAKVTQIEFAEAIAGVLGLSVVVKLEPEPGVLSRIPTKLARQELLLPLRDTGEHVEVATCLPFHGAGIDRAAFACGKPVKFFLATPTDLDEAIHRAYINETDHQSHRLNSIILKDNNSKDSEEVNTSATEKLASSLLNKAITMRSSDLHLQPYVKGSEVRFRIDGVLQRIALLPDGVGDRIIRYFKAHSDGMEPTVTNVPQDGRMSLTIEHRQIDLRISVLPAVGGESLVIRFLEQGKVYSLSKIGLSLKSLQIIRGMLSNSSGIILMTGPTGSGKSSTLYSMISEINQIGINIISIENPVEYKVPGLIQVEVNEKAGLTFPSVIRSCMRQDPDVLLIGEIRDKETAEIALQAAVTGHLVLSTLHTNDAVTSISRLTGLGINPAVLSDALSGVIAQRLVRQLCKKCRRPIEENELNTEEHFFESISNITPSYRAEGCEECNNSGYYGRLPIVEIFEITDEIRKLITDGNINSEILKQENHGKIKTLSGSASRLIVSGETTVMEVARVIGRSFWTDLAFEYGTKSPSSIPLFNENKTSLTGILLLTSDENLDSELQKELSSNNFSCYTCQSAKEANQLLKAHEEIVFAVVDLEEQDDEKNIEFIHNARVELYWSYLPALLLLPENHVELEKKLIADGATSEMLIKPTNVKNIFERIKAHINI